MSFAAPRRLRAMELRLEVVQVPVADVDRAKRFYVEGAGFVCDHDAQVSDAVRVVQLTPPGSACSIVIGTGMISMVPGSLEGLQLVTGDMEQARGALLEGGVEVTEPVALGREGGPSFLHASFEDPDGNRWVLQELPG
jgi:catechol 2,3-dioxygenase-like lactoylglutathione lyase family enzyme